MVIWMKYIIVIIVTNKTLCRTEQPRKILFPVDKQTFVSYITNSENSLQSQ